MRRILSIAVALFLCFTLLYAWAASRGWTDEAAWSQWLRGASQGSAGRAGAAGLVVGLLAADLVLPVPSSVVMTLSGTFLGFAAGSLASFAGAMISALLGYALCRRFGRPMFERLTGPGEFDRVERFLRDYGSWAIVLSRSVPMLTEVMSCLAGLGGMNLPRFAALAAAGTLPICLVYAWAGAAGSDPAGVGWAVVLAFAIPALGFGFLRLAARRRER